MGLYALELDDKVFHAVHMFAVMSAYNSRKHAQIITDEDAVFNLIWEGHRTAQFYHKGLEKRYKGIWHNSNVRPNSTPRNYVRASSSSSANQDQRWRASFGDA